MTGAGAGVRIDRAERLLQQRIAVAMIGDADEGAGIATRQLVFRLTGVFERVPCNFEKQALLRIHARRFARRDVEESGIEIGDALEQNGGWIRTGGPAVRAKGGESAGSDHLPERFAVGRIRKAARHADDRDRIRRAAQLGDLAAQFRDDAAGALELVAHSEISSASASASSASRSISSGSETFGAIPRRSAKYSHSRSTVG